MEKLSTVMFALLQYPANNCDGYSDRPTHPSNEHSPAAFLNSCYFIRGKSVSLEVVQNLLESWASMNTLQVGAIYLA